ncbi:bone sialoprotein 2 [Nycticebus coucang]|uniref:bone sialoprotein 2 n=1 Tax=Nycticebus coucang TaxID=9470 RepID=UPI00234DB89F|nr:bone sialoprotein 2 [Nycticebus coucang]
MKTALILLSILGMACAFSMKNLHRRVKPEDSEENGVFKYRPRYYLYKHAYFYPPLKRFPVQGSSDSSEENGDGDSSEEEEEEEETSNEEENDENSNEDEESEADNTTLFATTPDYGEVTPGTGLAAIQLPRKAGDMRKQATKKKESDEEEEEEEEEENEENEAEVDENEQGVNGTSTNSTETENGTGSSGGDAGEGGEDDSVTGETTSPNGGFPPTTAPPEVYGTPSTPFGKTTTVDYEGEYEQTGTNEYDGGYQVYDSENGEPRGDTYRAYEDEYSYYKGQGYDGYEGYYYHQ